MPDTLSIAERSERMRLIRSKDTKPEMLVRRIIFSMGHRYRLHSRSLPGHPDIVFSRQRKAVFVHGCFWHRHANCRKARLPKSKLDYWLLKLAKNRNRDKINEGRLRKLGWRILVVWECQTRHPAALRTRIDRFLKHP
jgi:DNA mismatch endonuclease (patch repair protein)